MPVMPIPRRVRSFHGPHTTCLHAACGPARASRPARTKYNNFDVYVRARWLYGFIRFLLYFSCSLFTAALWGALAALFCLQYLGVRVLLRFQLKLSALLLLLGRRRVDFRLLNELLVYGIHVTMLLVGGLGWCFMVFVDIPGRIHAASSYPAQRRRRRPPPPLLPQPGSPASGPSVAAKAAHLLPLAAPRGAASWCWRGRRGEGAPQDRGFHTSRVCGSAPRSCPRPAPASGPAQGPTPGVGEEARGGGADRPPPAPGPAPAPSSPLPGRPPGAGRRAPGRRVRARGRRAVPLNGPRRLPRAPRPPRCGPVLGAAGESPCEPERRTAGALPAAGRTGPAPADAPHPAAPPLRV
ncbi:hypothetical protein R6Z07M_003682 [Ovis aries]